MKHHNNTLKTDRRT